MPHTPETRARALEKMKRLRREWLQENGPCKFCGSAVRLEVDHVDRATKVHHAVWSWSDERRARELAKCRVLCQGCHRKRHTDDGRGWLQQRIVSPDGMAWCANHKAHLPVEQFSKYLRRWNGLYHYCKECESTLRKNYKGRRRRGRVAEPGIAPVC